MPSIFGGIIVIVAFYNTTCLADCVRPEKPVAAFYVAIERIWIVENLVLLTGVIFGFTFQIFGQVRRESDEIGIIFKFVFIVVTGAE